MPIFNNEITFIHIPKSGGTSVEKFMLNNGYTMSLFTATGSIFINGHTPQHCTFNELEELNLLTEKIFAIWRNEVDRVVSEYFYILDHRPDIKQRFNSFDEFLDLFLDKKNALIFDNHNLSNKDYLTNKEGVIDPRITIFEFFDHEKIEAYLGMTGLRSYQEMKTEKNFHLNTKQLEKIKVYYGL